MYFQEKPPLGALPRFEQYRKFIRLSIYPSAPWQKNLHAEPRIKLGPALQQADAVPTELRCTLNVKVMYDL